jgi:hypothetical protein
MELTFVSYDGEYPNLCSGELILAIDGVPVVFPDHCMEAGGSMYFDDDELVIQDGEWKITNFPKDFPENLKSRANELINENIEPACCG